jgi:hypothetical protein
MAKKARKLSPVKPKISPIRLLPAALVVTFLALIIFNAFWWLRLQSDPLTQARFKTISLSRGERYYGRLWLWHQAALVGDWVLANRLAANLDPLDIKVAQERLNPEYLKKQLNYLVVKANKTTDDWLELARLQYRVGKLEDAKAAIAQAYKLDPLRTDVDTLYHLFRQIK